MDTIVQGIFDKLTTHKAQQIGETVGLNAQATQRIVAQATPLMIAAMAKKAKDPKQGSDLAHALDEHDASAFDKINQIIDPRIDTKGDRILGHVLGDKTSIVTKMLAQNNLMKTKQAGSLLAMVAPLIMGQIGQQKKDFKLGSDGILDLLTAQSKTIEAKNDPMYKKLAKKVFDKNGNGSFMDEILGFAMKFLKK